MQVASGVTLPPWLSSSWLNAMPAYNELLRRQLQREHSRSRYHDHMQAGPGLTLYAYGPYGRNPQPIFRFGGFPGVNAARQGSGNGATAAGSTTWNQYPFQFDPIFAQSGDLSRIPGVLVRGARPPVNVEWEVASGAPVGPSAGHGGAPTAPGGFALSPRATLRAWLFGTALVVLVVVLVKAIDKCLDLNLLKSRRRSQEWPTPSVRATNRQMADNSVVIIPEEEFSSTDRPADYSEVISVDLPPPYSECLRDEQIPDPGRPKLDHEEPPPDYNDTYVEFSNKNGVASVLIYSARRTPLVNRREVSGTSGSNSNDTSEQNVQNTGHDEEANSSSVRNETESNSSDTRNANRNAQVIKYVISDDTPNTVTDTACCDTNAREDNSEATKEGSNEESIVMV